MRPRGLWPRVRGGNMRTINNLLLAVVLAALCSTSASAVNTSTTTLKVFIHDQRGELYPVQDVTVAAVEFGMNGPSTYTQVGVTDGTGYASLTLDNNHSFNLYYTSNGYSPSISDQFNNPAYDPNRYVWAQGNTVYSTFTVTSGLADVGQLKQDFTGATPGMVLFGGVYSMTAQMQAGTGIAATGTGNGTLVVDNVPFARANTYNIGLYDPTQNRGIGRNVMSDLGDGSANYPGPTVISYDAAHSAALDFGQSVPPARVDNSQVSASTSGASVEGVLWEVGYPTATIAHMGIGVKACVGTQWQTWVNTDENGRFQLYGLTPGVTYYLNVMGGCVWNNNANACYDPYSSPNYNAQDICQVDNSLATLDDIDYVSSDVMYKNVTLKRMPPSTGKIKVCVKSPGNTPIPNSNIGLNPDGTPWPVNGDSCNNANNYTMFFSTDFVVNPGFSSINTNTGVDGCATLNNLPSGNYMVNVWTPFTNGSNGTPSYNGGPDAQFGWGNNSNSPAPASWAAVHCSGYGADDYRVTVDTAASTTKVYDSSGTLVLDASSSQITYTVSTGGNTSGRVSGTASFPGVVDLRNNPILISLYGQCNNGSPCPAGNFTVLASSGADHYSYTINVSSGFSYYMNANATGWGRINQGGGDNSVHLESAPAVTVDMNFTPAGTLTGTLYKPDGSVFTPAGNQYIGIDADTNNGWASAQVQKDGTFSMTSVLPGVNRINLNASGDTSVPFNYALPSPAPAVTITAGTTSTLNINLVNANNVGIKLSTAALPDPTVIMDPSGSDMLLGFKAVPLPAGSVFTADTIIRMLTGGDSDLERKFRYSPLVLSGGNGQCGSPWPGGFCGAALPSPAVYDFYLMRSGDFGKGGASTDNPYPHFAMLNSVKNVIVDAPQSTSAVHMPYTMSVSSGVLVDLTPAVSMAQRGNATVYGAVTAANFFRAADYDATGGNFDNFVKYLPVAALYAENGGALSAAGIVVPPPAFIANNDPQFNFFFSQGYQKFHDFLYGIPGGFGYEIRGLAPNTCYTEVMTTPNYPHYQRRVCTGASGTRTALDVNLDSAVGAGGTVQGIVRSSDSASAPIPNASVQLDMEGSVARTAVTTSSGAYRFEGISGGLAKISFTATGHAKAIIEQPVSDSIIYTDNVYLSTATGSITGTVYSQKLPYAKVQAGAKIVAYDDTYNHLNPKDPLPLLITTTGDDGAYVLDGVVTGHLYKVFLKVPGKYTLEVDTTAADGVVPGVDFTMLPKPLDVEVFAKDGPNLNDPALGTYDFTILNPQDFSGGNVTYGPSPYSAPGTPLNFSKVSSGELNASIPRNSLVDNVVYVLHIEATSLSNKTITKEILFGKNYTNSQQNIDDTMLGDDSDDGTGHKNNEASVDKTGGDPSALVLPAGALITSTVAAVPACSFTAEDRTSVAVSTKVAAVGSGATVAGNLYTVSLSSVAQTGRSMELTLAYDKTITDASTLNVAQYNNSSGKWDTVPGLATINPVKGTITVKLKKLASVLSRRAYGPQAVFDGEKYVFRPQAAGGSATTSGTFTVLNYVGTDTLAAGAGLKVFNYPNPFNLKTKAMSNAHGAALMPATTYGTMIHVEVPAGNDGPCHIRIYTLAGELVKDISDTCVGGKYNYFAWDGRNKNGQEVANGVYYGVVDLSGSKPDRKDATFKMAVIK